MAAMIDEAVRGALNAWNAAAESALHTILEHVPIERVSRTTGNGASGPELNLLVDGSLVCRLWWRWEDGVGRLQEEWTPHWQDRR